MNSAKITVINLISSRSGTDVKTTVSALNMFVSAFMEMCSRTDCTGCTRPAKVPRATKGTDFLFRGPNKYLHVLSNFHPQPSQTTDRFRKCKNSSQQPHCEMFAHANMKITQDVIHCYFPDNCHLRRKKPFPCVYAGIRWRESTTGLFYQLHHNATWVDNKVIVKSHAIRCHQQNVPLLVGRNKRKQTQNLPLPSQWRKIQLRFKIFFFEQAAKYACSVEFHSPAVPCGVRGKLGGETDKGVQGLTLSMRKLSVVKRKTSPKCKKTVPNISSTRFQRLSRVGIILSSHHGYLRFFCLSYKEDGDVVTSTECSECRPEHALILSVSESTCFQLVKLKQNTKLLPTLEKTSANSRLDCHQNKMVQSLEDIPEHFRTFSEKGEHYWMWIWRDQCSLSRVLESVSAAKTLKPVNYSWIASPYMYHCVKTLKLFTEAP